MRKTKIYLDNCCFNRPYDDQTQLKIELDTKAKLFIQDLIKENKVDLVWSYILDYENSRNIYYEKRDAILKWKRLATIDIDETDDILEIAREIQLTNIKNADSLHVACAIVAGCDYFITVDRRLTRYQDNRIRICNPNEFLHLWESELNE